MLNLMGIVNSQHPAWLGLRSKLTSPLSVTTQVSSQAMPVFPSQKLVIRMLCPVFKDAFHLKYLKYILIGKVDLANLQVLIYATLLLSLPCTLFPISLKVDLKMQYSINWYFKFP